jgi:hypothetical protein
MLSSGSIICWKAQRNNLNVLSCDVIILDNATTILNIPENLTHSVQRRMYNTGRSFLEWVKKLISPLHGGEQRMPIVHGERRI